MRVLFLIPRSPPPELKGDFSKEFKVRAHTRSATYRRQALAHPPRFVSLHRTAGVREPVPAKGP